MPGGTILLRGRTVVTLIFFSILLAQSSLAGEVVIVEFGPGISVVRQGGKVQIIDYENGQFCRIGGGCPGPTCQPLDLPDTTSRDREREEIFSEVSRLDGPQPLHAGLLFGPRAMLMRSVSGVRLTRYGLEFSPERIDFRFNKENRDTENLMSAARSARHLSGQYPLLARIDIVPLFALLGGVPVEMTRKGDTVPLRFRYRDPDDLRREWLDWTFKTQ